MATLNLTRKKSFNKTAETRWASALVEYTDLADGVVDDAFELFVLPENAVIVESIVSVIDAAQATATCDIGFDGGNELNSNLDIATAAVTTTAADLDTGTGKTVTLKPETVLPTQGKFAILVGFVEYGVTDGRLLNYSETA